MTTSKRSTGQNSGEQLTLLPEGSPASRFPQPGSEKAKQMTVTSGRRCLELLQKLGQPSSLLRTLLESKRFFSTNCNLKWRARSMPQKRRQTLTLVEFVN